MPRSPSETREPMRTVDPPIISRRKREYHQTLVFMSGTLTAMLLCLVAVGLALGFAKYLYDTKGPLPHSEVIVIPKGEGVSEIADRLERKNIIIDKRVFKAAVMYFGVQNKLKAGEYEITKQASMRQVLDHLLEGKSIMHSLAFPEGLTTQQLVERISANEMLKGELTTLPEEGSLLPDTYLFTRGTERNELVRRMRTAQQKFLENLWNQRHEDLPFTTKEEALILASIVEKETGIAGERPHIAGVFINRLRKGIRLQSDPTIIYGLVGGVGKLGRGIRKSELEKETPYNTYKINGLPPTPIANPGRAAIEAVLRPKATEDLYFVADGTGGHVFAKTLKEHEKNVREWRKIERQRKAESERLAREKEKLEKEAEPDATGNEKKPEQQSLRHKDQDEILNLTPDNRLAAAELLNQEASQIPLPVKKPQED